MVPWPAMTSTSLYGDTYSFCSLQKIKQRITKITLIYFMFLNFLASLHIVYHCGGSSLVLSLHTVVSVQHHSNPSVQESLLLVFVHTLPTVYSQWNTQGPSGFNLLNKCIGFGIRSDATCYRVHCQMAVMLLIRSRKLLYIVKALHQQVAGSKSSQYSQRWGLESIPITFC